MTDTGAGTPLTAEQLVPFLLSVIASGERLTADEVATIRALDAARSRPATGPAGMAVEQMIAELVGVESALDEARERLRKALALGPVAAPHWPRWECSSCHRNANQCGERRAANGGSCCHDCDHDR